MGGPMTLLGKPEAFAGVPLLEGVTFLQSEHVPDNRIYGWSTVPDPRPRMPELFVKDDTCKPEPIRFRHEWGMPIIYPRPLCSITSICFEPTPAELQAERKRRRDRIRGLKTKARKLRKVRRRYLRHVVRQSCRS